MWQVGELVDSRYEVTRVHEQGGMGVVYRVRHLEWGIDLAVKSPRPELTRSAEDQRQFVAEAETWVSLGLHPHVCTCHYVRVLDGVPRVFAEYVPGGSLHEWISDQRLYAGDEPEVAARILDIAVQTAWGLDHAHRQGLVHRDVKPANVLLDTEDGTVTAKITDFGLARARDMALTIGADAPSDASVLVPGGGGMTPRYASPEQAAGEPVGRRTDIYSFGVSVLEMFTGEATWMAGPVAGAALTGYRSGEATGVTAIPPALGNLLARCLRDDPAARPKSLADVATVLSDIYESVTGRKYPRPEPVTADLLSDELNNRGVSLRDLDRHAEADEAFARALAADPQHARAVYNAGLVGWRRADLTDMELVAEIEAARSDGGDPWEVRYVLAQVHLERGDPGTARALLDGIARERPEEPEVLAALRSIRSGAITDARCVQERQVPWPERPAPSAWRRTRTRDEIALALGADGRFLLTGGWEDGTIRYWDVESGQCLHVLKGHRRPVCALDLTPGGRFAASACVDGTVRFWDLARRRTGGSVKSRRLYASDHPAPWDPSDGLGELPTAIRLTPDGGCVLYAVDSSLRAWDTRTGRMSVLDGAENRLVEVSADGRRALYVGRRSLSSRTGVVRVWDLAAGRCERELPVSDSAVSALCFSPDGRFAAAGSHRTVRVWDLADGRCLHVLTGRPAPSPTTPRGAYSLDLSAGARFLLTGDRIREDDGVQVWDLDGGRCLRTFRGHPGGTTVLRLEAGGRFALSAGPDRTVRRWELPGEYRGTPLLSRPRRHIELSRLGARVDALVAEAEGAMADGRFPAALDLLRQARLVPGHEREPRVLSAWWALGRRSERTGLRAAWQARVWQADAPTGIDLARDGRIAVSGSRDRTVRVWDTREGTCLRVLRGHTGPVHSVCLSADGRLALSSASDRSVRQWDLETGACLRVVTSRHNRWRPWTRVRFGADERQVVLVEDDRLEIWDLSTGDLVREVEQRFADNDVCVGDDGHLATLWGAGMSLWDLAAGTGPRVLTSGAGPLGGVSLGPGGRLALCGETHGGLRLWDTGTGQVLRTIDRPPLPSQRPGQNPPHTVRMTADGRFAVSGSHWSCMDVWDVRNGRHLRALDGHGPGVSSLAMTPDGRHVLAARDGHLRLWELDWELAAHDAADWDDGAAPQLEAFLRRHGPGGAVRAEAFEALLHRLQDTGYGWLRPEGVRARLTGTTATEHSANDHLPGGTAR